jgi:O-antigen/teichoic acid export membrane protein
VAANVLLITQIGFIASAYVAIASELALLIPFYVGIRRHLAPIPWARVAWKPLACALPMALLFWLLPGRASLLALPLGLALYLVGLVVLQVFDAEERAVVARVVPLGRLRGR